MTDRIVSALHYGPTPPAGRAHTDSLKLSVSQRLLTAWMKRPHERLSQFIVNATSSDPFFVEDEALVVACEDYVGGGE